MLSRSKRYLKIWNQILACGRAWAENPSRSIEFVIAEKWYLSYERFTIKNSYSNFGSCSLEASSVWP